MNLLLSKFQAYSQRKKELFENNKNAIFTANFRLFKLILILAQVLFFVLVIISYTLPGFYSLKSAYWTILIISICISAFRYNRFCERYALLGLYFLFIVLFMYGVYASVIITPDQMATSIIGFFCIMPLAVIDKSWRINLVIFVLYLIHTFLVFQLKSYNLAIDDALNCAVFMICGMYIGENMRVTKLTNFDLQRNAEIQMKFDCLTGLCNRHEMLDKLKANNQLDSSLHIKGVIMLDVDHFKQFNDFYGHLAGDDCLSSLGKALKEFGESKNLEFFRYGGEEFLAFSYTHEHEDILALAEQLQQSIMNLKIPFEYSSTGYVTISLGVATSNCSGNQKGESLIKMADMALYKAKETGRNRVYAYDHLIAD